MPTAGFAELAIPSLGGVSIGDDIRYAAERKDKQRLDAWGQFLGAVQLYNQARSTEFQQGYTLWTVAKYQNELKRQLRQNHAGLSALAQYGSKMGLDTRKWTADKPEDEMAADVANSIIAFQINRLGSIEATERTRIGLSQSQADILGQAALRGINIGLAAQFATSTPEQRQQFFLDNPMTSEDVGGLAHFSSLMSKQTGKPIGVDEIMASYPVELRSLMPQEQKFKDDASGAAWGAGYVAKYDDAVKQIDELISTTMKGTQRGQPDERKAAQAQLDYYQRVKAAMPKFLKAGAIVNPGAFTSTANQYLLEQRGVATPGQAKVAQQSDEVAGFLESGGKIVAAPGKAFAGRWAITGVNFMSNPASKKQVGLKPPYSADAVVQGAVNFLQSDAFKTKYPTLTPEQWIAKHVAPQLQSAVRAILNGESVSVSAGSQIDGPQNDEERAYLESLKR